MLDSTPRARALKIFIVVVVVAANWIGGCFLAKFLLPKPSSFIVLFSIGTLIASFSSIGIGLIFTLCYVLVREVHKYIVCGPIDGKVEKEQDYSAYEIEQATQELDAFLKEGR